MSKATPGPWRRGEGTFDGGRIYGTCVGGVQRVEREFLIAEVRGWGHLSYREDGAEMQDANAQLITAAPDLLEAVKQAVHFFDIDSPMDYDDAMAACERVNQLCKDAIAKAEGKET